MIDGPLHTEWAETGPSANGNASDMYRTGGVETIHLMALWWNSFIESHVVPPIVCPWQPQSSQPFRTIFLESRQESQQEEKKTGCNKHVYVLENLFVEAQVKEIIKGGWWGATQSWTWRLSASAIFRWAKWPAKGREKTEGRTQQKKGCITQKCTAVTCLLPS